LRTTMFCQTKLMSVDGRGRCVVPLARKVVGAGHLAAAGCRAEIPAVRRARHRARMIVHVQDSAAPWPSPWKPSGSGCVKHGVRGPGGGGAPGRRLVVKTDPALVRTAGRQALWRRFSARKYMGVARRPAPGMDEAGGLAGTAILFSGGLFLPARKRRTVVLA